MGTGSTLVEILQANLFRLPHSQVCVEQRNERPAFGFGFASAGDGSRPCPCSTTKIEPHI